MPYIANTDEDRAEMLSVIGVADVDELWRQAGVTSPHLVWSDNLPEGKSELEVIRMLDTLSRKNAVDLVCFLGLGCYDHLVPAAVGEIIGRGEFYTSYTPYQPEASQGTLQAMYEFQSGICRLTDMEVANASLYDGGTALFEAMMMSIRLSRRRKAIMAGTVSPIYREMIRCYSRHLDIELIVTDPPHDGTQTDQGAVLDLMDDDTACILVQYPNVFGTLESWDDVVATAAEKKIITVCSTYPMALSKARTPGNMGFDIVVGEGQSLGLDMSFGGPYLGYIATRTRHMRKLPGRIVGRTVDGNGRVGYVLTLQAREQHIRREQATSNICTNQSLCALAAIVYMSCVGKDGLARIGELNTSKAVYARDLLLAIPGVEAVDQPAFFNEFVVRVPVDAAELIGRMIDKGFAAGFPLGRYFPERPNDILVAVTEKRTREEIHAFANAMDAVL